MPLLDLELEPPAVDDDLDRRRARREPPHGSGPGPGVRGRRGRGRRTDPDRTAPERVDRRRASRPRPRRRAGRTGGDPDEGRPGQRGHRSIARARPSSAQADRGPLAGSTGAPVAPEGGGVRRHAPERSPRHPPWPPLRGRDRERGRPLTLGDRAPGGIDPVDRQLAGPETLVRRDEPVEREGRLDTRDDDLVEGPRAAVPTRPLASRRRPSAWRSGGRSRARCDSRPRRRCRPGCPDRRASPSARSCRATGRSRGPGPRRRGGPRSRGESDEPPPRPRRGRAPTAGTPPRARAAPGRCPRRRRARSLRARPGGGC